MPGLRGIESLEPFVWDLDQAAHAGGLPGESGAPIRPAQARPARAPRPGCPSGARRRRPAVSPDELPVQEIEPALAAAHPPSPHAPRLGPARRGVPPKAPALSSAAACRGGRAAGAGRAGRRGEPRLRAWNTDFLSRVLLVQPFLERRE